MFSRPAGRPRRAPAVAATVFLAILALLTSGAPAQAAVPTGYVTVSGWSTSGTNATATTIGGTTAWGPVGTTGTNQTVGMDAAWTIDGVQVPRRQLTAATVTASTTNCLNGAPVDTVRECDGNTTRLTTITFPHTVVDPIIAVAARGAVFTTPATGTGTKTYCATSWTDHAVLAVDNVNNFGRSRITAPTLGTGQRVNSATSEVYFDTTIMEQTANECVAPGATGSVTYIQIRGSVESVRLESIYRAMPTRNTGNVSPRRIAVAPGWQYQPYIMQPADLAVTKTAPATAVGAARSSGV